MSAKATETHHEEVYVDPNPTGDFQAFKYVMACVAVVLSVVTSGIAITSMATMWTSGANGTVLATASGFMANLIGPANNGVLPSIAYGIAAILFAVAAWMLYRIVTREAMTRPQLLQNKAYNLSTKLTIGYLVINTVLAVASVVGVLVSSLLLIGTSAPIGDMYLNTFIPQLLIGGLSAVAAYFVSRIAKGKNVSTMLSIILISVASVAFIGLAVTAAVKVRDTGTSTSSSSSVQQQYQDYIKKYSN